MGKRKLLLSGSSVAELRKECEEFLNETGGYTGFDHQLPLVPQVQEVASYPPQVPTEGLPAAPVLAEVDKRGIPWDPRVHSSSKELTAKGSWRKRRGVEDAELERVEAELRQSAPVPVAPPVPLVTPPPPSVPLGNAPVVSPVLAAPVIPSVTPAVPSGATTVPFGQISPPQAIVSLAHNAGTFKQQMPQVLAELIKQGKINQEWLAAVKMECKVQELWEMSDDQKNELFEILCNYNLITRMP